jgi:tetratricopeptide (TPR) repeat protein
MYRRILYTERIYFAQRAAEAASRLNRKKAEAFLRIDALGWLLIEEGLFADAQRELMTGLAIAQSMPAEDSTASDLIALATTFLSRSYLEQGDIDKASELINQALAVNCLPIVECRVYMVAGDVAYSKNNYLEAIRLYEHATRITQVEEDVDFDARLHYCLGSACLAENDLVRAESEFSIVLDIEQQAINIVLIYAKYGLARVALAKGDREKARFLAQEAREELSLSIASHRLLDQIENLLKDLDTQ